MIARLKQAVTCHAIKVPAHVHAVRDHWRTMARHERRRVIVHMGCVTWLAQSFAHEWHAIGQADLAFLALSLVSEWDSFKSDKSN